MKPFRSEKIGYDIFLLFLSLQSFEEGRVSVQVHDPSIPMFYERLSIFGGKFMKIRRTFHSLNLPQTSLSAIDPTCFETFAHAEKLIPTSL